MTTAVEVNVTTGQVVKRALTADEVALAGEIKAASLARQKAESDERAGRDKAEADWRAAVGAATSLDAVKAALLGTGLTVQVDVRQKV